MELLNLTSDRGDIDPAYETEEENYLHVAKSNSGKAVARRQFSDRVYENYYKMKVANSKQDPQDICIFKAFWYRWFRNHILLSAH